LADFVENKWLPTFDKKPTKNLLREKIHDKNNDLVFDEITIDNLNVDYKTGTVTLKPKNSKIYIDEPFDFRFYTELSGVIDNSTPFFVESAHPNQSDIRKMLKKANSALEEESIDVDFDTMTSGTKKNGYAITVKGNSNGAYSESDSIVINFKIKLDAVFDKRKVDVEYTKDQIIANKNLLYDAIKAANPNVQ